MLRSISDDVDSRPSFVKPFVLLAARLLGPGPRRLSLVKLAHELDDRQDRRAAA
ncbi:MAG TPA: hypothetical protein VG426_00175 [Candidatus Dormibacteraeota bacterium]|nr:hypothetical protein [Candidatus Dormibacteraeota bacterium]